jgi:hypothetical protein
MLRFIETLSPLVQTSTQTLATRLVINQHVYLFKENDDLWDDSELDKLIAQRVLGVNTVLRGKGHFVCEVSDPHDYDAILSIGAGYRPYTPPQESPKREAAKSTIPSTRKASASATKAPRKVAPPAKPNAPRPGRSVTELAVDPAAG